MKKITALLTSCCVLIITFVAFYLLNEGTETNINQIKQIEHNEATLPPAYFNLQNLLSIGNAADKKHQLNQFFTYHMIKNPQETLAIIKKIKKLDDRQLCYDVALAVWFTHDIAALAQWLNKESPRIDLDLALKNLILASSQAKNSLLFANKLSVAAVREQKLTHLFSKWIPTNTEQIIHWSIEKRSDSNIWLTHAFKLLSTESHTKSINSLSYLNANKIVQVRTALQSIIDNYTFNTINTNALLALQTLEPYTIREEAIAALLPLLSNEKHLNLASITAVLDCLLQSKLKDELKVLLALNWADKNPHEAGLFAQSLTGDARAHALSTVVESWADKDLEAADEWLKTIDGDLDLASSSIARKAAKLGNVQISDEWIDDIIEEDIRDAAIEDAIQAYYKDSPASGIYHLVYQKNLTVQKKLKLLHEIYPNENFLSPNQALDEIGRLERLTSAY